MQIVDEETHRVLAYIDALNRHGVRPARAAVDAFAANPKRRYARTGGIYGSAFSNLPDIVNGRLAPAETYCQYLERLVWINLDHGAVELTAISRALLRALNAPVIDEDTSDVVEVVLDPKNPFAYAQALNGLSSVRGALLVEPYFRLEQLMDIAEFENIERVLVGSQLKAKDFELLATGLAAMQRDLEIRKASELHDRYLIPAGEGPVVMLGASLGGIGKKVSTMTTLGEVASIALRDAHEEIWRAAQRIEPKRPGDPPAVQSEAAEGPALEPAPAKKPAAEPPGHR